MITLTTAQNALKTVYLDALSAQLNTQVDPIFSAIKQSSTDVYGRNIIKLIPFGINGGVGTGTEDGALPASCETHYVNCVTTLKNLYGTIEITDKAIRASSNDEGAFVNLLGAEMDALLESSKFNLARMFYGDGTGTLSTITAIDTSKKTIKVENTAPFMEGLLLDFYISDVLDPDMQSVLVTQVDRVNREIYLDKIIFKVEYIISRISGKPGLCKTISLLFESGYIEYENSVQNSSSSEKMTQEEIKEVFQNIRKLSRNLEDILLADSLCKLIDDLMEKM